MSNGMAYVDDSGMPSSGDVCNNNSCRSDVMVSVDEMWCVEGDKMLSISGEHAGERGVMICMTDAESSDVW